MAPALRMFKVSEHKDESPSTRTMRFRGRIDARPGQFVMVWVPGIDEFPMSISYAGEHFGITYQIVGEGTKALSKTPVGGVIGIRGPFGRGFETSDGKLLVVAGGAGIAPTAPLVEEVSRRGVPVCVALGARTADELVFEERCRSAGADLHVSTDDGSKGHSGLVTELAASILRRDEFAWVCACGPERMITTMMKTCRSSGLPMQASVERIMKCGIGICDSCAIDGVHVCTDGPVFGLEELERLGDLGKSRLDRTGRKVRI